MRAILLTCALALPLAAACTTAYEDEPRPRGAAAFADDPRLGEKVDSICFAGTIDGFSNNTRDTVVLREGVRDEYLVEVFGTCPNLEYAQTIGIDSALSCVSRSDSLIVSESIMSLRDNTGIGPNRCTIQAIYEWDSDAADEAEEDKATEPG